MIEASYLLLGPETGEKELRLKEIRNELRKQIGSEPELHRFYPFETENGEIFAALDNNSLFADYRLVLLSQAENLSTSLATSLAQYLAHPSTSATLIIISSENSVSPKIMKAVSRENTKVFYELFDNQKADWVRDFFRRYGQTITSDAIDLLLDLVENNTQELRTTCTQLALFWQSGEKKNAIGADDVEAYIHHSRQEDAFTLFPEIAKGTLKQAIDTLHSILGSGDSGAPILLVSGLLWQFRRLLSIEEALASGSSEYEAFSSANVLGKASSIRNPKDKTTYHIALATYDIRQCRNIIATLADADLASKEAGNDMVELVLEQMLYKIIVKKGEQTKGIPFASFPTA
ncbi:DNA polymerase III subunit delta [uncultured Sphaerochaeta sp.]|uniref:DNA polymerase III subunit delta n=1 Tax=uncultured Sphaerochaeta sp. TaxID=886478 RepID=UPI002A0A99E9|nr:DNA polymerase III subunit delta [uncultured Sphaerochaeta sp.]